MDAFCLALSYGVNKISKKSIVLTALFGMGISPVTPDKDPRHTSPRP